MKKNFFKIAQIGLPVLAALFLTLVFSPAASAGWGWSVGYNNPPGSQLGVNFMHTWSKWAFEVGVGSVVARNTEDDPDTTEDESKDSTVGVGGDVDLKYFFGGGTFKPFAQFGLGYGISISDEHGAGAGFGGGFAGLGFFVGGLNSFHVYGSANIGRNVFFSLGVGSGF